MAGIQRVVINQPGLRPGQPGAQITVPLSTLQVSNCLHFFITLVYTNSSLIPICAGASGWPGNSHWSAWPPLGQDRNWPVSGELKYIFDPWSKVNSKSSDITSGSTWCWRYHHCLPCHSPTLATTGMNVQCPPRLDEIQVNKSLQSESEKSPSLT